MAFRPSGFDHRAINPAMGNPHAAATRGGFPYNRNSNRGGHGVNSLDYGLFLRSGLIVHTCSTGWASSNVLGTPTARGGGSPLPTQAMRVLA